MIINGCNYIEIFFYDDTSIKMPFEVINSIRFYDIGNTMEFDRSEIYSNIETCKCFMATFNDKIYKYSICSTNGESIPIVDRIVSKKDIDIVVLYFEDSFKAIRVPYYPDEKEENIYQRTNKEGSPLSILIENERLYGIEK